MKRIWYIFLLLGSFQPLMPHSYIESLDAIIEQRIKAITNESLLDVVAISQQVDRAIDEKISLSAVQELLQSKKFISFFVLDSSVSVNEIKFALGVKIYLYCLDCCQAKMLHKSLKNYDSLDYWQHEQFYENRNLLDKNITRWVHDENYKKSIQANISHLESISKQTASFLGLVRHNKQILAEAFNRESFEKNLMMAVRLQDIQLNGSVEHDYEACDMYSVLTNTIQQFHSLSANLSAQYIQCQPPQHFERNWVAYSSTAAGLCACAAAYYMYKNDVDACADAAFKAGSDLWNDKVTKHVKKIINILSGTNKEHLLDTTREAAILDELYRQGDQTSPLGSEVTTGGALAGNSLQLAGQATSHVVGQVSNSFWGLLGYPNQSSTQESASQSSIVASSNQQPLLPKQKKALRVRVDQKDSVTLSQPLKNIGEVLSAGIRTGLNFGVNIQNAINNFYEEHQLTIAVAALLPAVAVAAGTVSASSRTYYAMSHQPIRRIIRDLEILLNDSVAKPVSFDREGKLYFLTELLKNKSDVLTMREHKMMEEDIAELQSKNLAYLQKFNIVQRMYHTYAFLLPGAI